MQYSFQDVYLSFLMVAAYSALVARYCSILWSRTSLLMCVYVCMYICIYALCTYMRMYVCIYVCIYVCL